MEYLKLASDTKNIANICEKYGILYWSIDDNGLVDVDCYVMLGEKYLNELPLQFGRVYGYFYCGDTGLESLKGAPYHVDEYAEFSENNLSCLNHMPTYVGGFYYLDNNQLYKIYDIPGRFFIWSNPVSHIYKYINKDNRLVVSVDYFKDCKVQVGRDIYIERFKSFLEDYNLDSDINIDELQRAGYTIK